MRHFTILILFIFYLTFDSNAQCPDVTAVMGTVQSTTSVSVDWTPPPSGIFDPEGYHIFYRKVGDPSYSTATQHKAPWINEIKYRGANEGFEIIGPDELDLNCYKVQLFRANGFRTAGNNGIRDLSGRFTQINANNNYFEAIWDSENFDNGGGYIALYYEGNSCDCPREDFLVEFLSYGNPASPDTMAATVHPILDNAIIQTTSATNSNFSSIGLTDFDPGDTPNDFSWQEMVHTPSSTNLGQVVYPKLAGSNDLITIEDLVPCTEYEFFIRSDCGGPSIGGIVPANGVVTTENSIKDASFSDNGVFINEFKVCEGANPNFVADINFQTISPNNNCSIQTTYFITNPAGIIENSFPSVSAVNGAIQSLPDNPYLIQAIGHHDILSGTGAGNDINNVSSTSCLRISSFPIDLKVFNIPTITTTPTVNPSQCGSSTGSITVNITGDNPALGTMSYKLNTNPWSTNSIFTNLPAGINTILVQYTDAVGNLNPNNCFASTTIILTDPSGPVVATSPSPVSCNGGNDGGIVLNPPGGANYSYVWSNGAMTQNVGNLTAGNYAVTITDGNTNCTSVIPIITVTEPTAISITISNLVDPSCNGGNDGSATTSAAGGSPNYSYTWSSGATSATANDLVPGTNSVTVVDINGCSSIQTFTLGNPPAINISAIQDSPVVCNGEANGSATITANGGTPAYTYLWDNGETAVTAILLTAGNHSYTVTDGNGCTNIGSVTISEPDMLGSNMPVTTNISCNGENDGEATISATGGNQPYTYEWSNGETTIKALSLPVGTSSYTVTDDKGCTFVSSVSITEPDLLSATAAVDQNVSCNGLMDGVGTISETGGTGPYTYVWGSTPQTQTVSNLAAGSTIFAVIDANGCVSTGTIFISQPAILTNAISNVQGVLCFNSSDGTAEATPNGGTAPYSYLWDTGETTAVANQLGPGVHSLTITDNKGCVIVENNILINNAQVYVASTTAQEVLCFSFSDGTATVSPIAPGTTVAWDAAAGNQTTPTAVGLSAGTYNVTITNSNGCSATASALINEPDEVTISFPGINTVSCIGIDETLTANATGGAGSTPSDYTYIWSNTTQGNAATIAINSTAVSFSVTATDSNGCVGETTNTITGLNPPVMSAIDPITIGEDDELSINLDDYVTNDSFDYEWNRTYLSGNCSAQNQSSGQTSDELTEQFSVDNQNTTGQATYSIVPYLQLNSGQQCVGDSVSFEVIILPSGETATFFIPDVYIKSLDQSGWDIQVSDTDNSVGDFNLQVFNRSGAKVHEGTLATAWTAADVQDGVYYYIISDGTTKVKTGSVLVQQ